MLNRYSLPNGANPSVPFSPHSGDGRSTQQAPHNTKSQGAPFQSGDGRSNRPVRTPFIPLYSGDGQGNKHSWSGDGRMNDAMPLWSEEARHQVANPLMPAYGGARSREQHVSVERPVLVEPTPQAVSVPLSEELSMNVNVQQTEPISQPKPRSKKNRDTWKLVALVVVFLVWVSTASTLLFLYMDRYLFP